MCTRSYSIAGLNCLHKRLTHCLETFFKYPIIDNLVVNCIKKYYDARVLISRYDDAQGE